MRHVGTDSVPSELPERVRQGVPAEERGAPALPVGDANERDVRSRRHGGNCIGGSRRAEPTDVEHVSFRGRTRMHGINESTRASSRQVGGDHYKDMAIQPSHFIRKNAIGWHEGNAIKYICRHNRKGGRKDVEKAIHYLQLILEEDYND